MPGKEMRKEERFPAAMLPAHLQSVRVLVNGIETVAGVFDASYSGFGFRIDSPPSQFILGSTLVIYPKESAKALYGVVVYAQPIDGRSTRVGVHLKEVGLFVEYRRELEQLISLVQET